MSTAVPQRSDLPRSFHRLLAEIVTLYLSLELSLAVGLKGRQTRVSYIDWPKQLIQHLFRTLSRLPVPFFPTLRYNKLLSYKEYILVTLLRNTTVKDIYTQPPVSHTTNPSYQAVRDGIRLHSLDAS